MVEEEEEEGDDDDELEEGEIREETVPRRRPSTAQPRQWQGQARHLAKQSPAAQNPSDGEKSEAGCPFQ